MSNRRERRSKQFSRKSQAAPVPPAAPREADVARALGALDASMPQVWRLWSEAGSPSMHRRAFVAVLDLNDKTQAALRTAFLTRAAELGQGILGHSGESSPWVAVCVPQMVELLGPDEQVSAMVYAPHVIGLRTDAVMVFAASRTAVVYKVIDRPESLRDPNGVLIAAPSAAPASASAPAPGGP